VAEIRIDWGAVNRMLRSPNGMVGRDLRRRGDRVVNRARQLAPGSMPSLITPPQIGHRAGDLSAKIESRHHASLWVLRGTGLYGPNARRITPVRAKALRFVLNGRVVYAKSVSGQRPNDFLGKALRQAVL
jgi:hypothetical protein